MNTLLSVVSCPAFRTWLQVLSFKSFRTGKREVWDKLSVRCWGCLIALVLLYFNIQNGYAQNEPYRISYDLSCSNYSSGGAVFFIIDGPSYICNNSATCSGSFYEYQRPTHFAVGTPSGAPGSGCNIFGTYALNASYCEFGVSASSCTVGCSGTVIIESNIGTTGTAIDPNKNYCPGETVSLSATKTLFSTFTWQYRVGSGSWVDIKNTTTGSTTVSGADIGGNYMQNIYFRVKGNGCNPVASGSSGVGPYVFSPGAVKVATYTDVLPKCKGGNDAKIIVNSLSRALTPGEVAIITLKNGAGLELGQTVQSSTLPIILDGADRTRFPDGISPGNYTLLVESFVGGTQPSSCGLADNAPATVRDQVELAASANVTSNHNGAMISCVGKSDGQITITASGGVGGYTYSADGGTVYQPSNVFGSMGAGNFTFTIKDNNQCTTTASAEIKSPAVLSISNAYVVTNYDGNGAGVSCHPNDTDGPKNDGSIKVEATGGTGVLQYSAISANAAHSVAYQNNTTVPGLYADPYTIYAKDQNGCTAVFSSVIPVSPPAEIVYSNIVPVDLTCAGIPTGSLEVQGVSGGIGMLRYSLDGVAFQNSNQFGGLAAGSFVITIKDSRGCTKETESRSVDQPFPITFSTIDISPQSCTERVDGVISLVPVTGGTGAHTYSIDDITYVPESNPVEFTGLGTGGYTIYVKDSKGCKEFATPYVGIKTVISGVITVAQPISCHGKKDGALNLTPGGGTSPYTFDWWNLATTEDITGLGDGRYYVTVTDVKGCEKTFDYDLQEPGILALQPVVSDFSGYGVSCKGAADGAVNLTVQGGTGPFTYNWSTGSTQKDVTGLLPGTYDIYVTDAHNCTASSLNIQVKEPPVLTVSVAKFKNISCKNGTDGELTGLAEGGVGFYRYSIDGTSWQQEALFTGLNAKLYTLRLQDGNGCDALPVNHRLGEPSELALSIIRQKDTSCGEANGEGVVEAKGGVGGYQYTWYDENDVVISSGAEATSLPNGFNKAVVQDGNGCLAYAVVVINDSDGPKVALQALEGLTCHDSNDGVIGIGVSEGLAPYTILWDTQESGLTINNVTGGLHWVEVRDAKGCRHKEIFDVLYPPALAANYVAAAPLCTGNADGSIGLDITGGNTGGYTYLWTGGETTSSLSNLKAGTYHVTIKDSKDCTLEQDIILTDPPLFTIDAGGDRTICVGQKLTVRAEADDATYEWKSDAGYVSTSREVVLTVPARYTLKVVNSNGCIAEDGFTLSTSNDLLQADFLMAAEAHAGDTVVLVDVSWPLPENIGWTLPSGATVLREDDAYADIIFGEPGEYTIVLTTHLGECIDHYTKTITILEERVIEGGREGVSVVKRFEVYPNPSDGAFSVMIEFARSVEGRLSMLNMAGTKVFLEESLQDQTEYTFHTALQSIPSGIYFLILEAGGKVYSKRIVIE